MTKKHHNHSEHCHHHHDELEMRIFAELYLLPYGYHPAADGTAIVDAKGNRVANPREICADLTVGMGALQPLEMVARLADGKFVYAHAHEVNVDTEDFNRVEFYFDEEYEWSGVEGREYTDKPVKVTASWLGDDKVKASAQVLVSPVQELVWMPAEYEISEDGLAFRDGSGLQVSALPQRATIAVGQSCRLRAVAKYGDGRYHLMSRTELEFVTIDDWVSSDYSADEDVYEIKLLAASEEPAEVMLTALASEDLLGSFFIEHK